MVGMDWTSWANVSCQGQAPPPRQGSADCLVAMIIQVVVAQKGKILPSRIVTEDSGHYLCRRIDKIEGISDIDKMHLKLTVCLAISNGGN
jgi:hypothetical protein